MSLLIVFLQQNVTRGPETIQDVSNEVVTERHTPYGAYYLCHINFVFVSINTVLSSVV